MPTKKQFQNIPTTIVGGFLGVGKTSAILHLMSQKPAQEKWSVLVNEFGSIGIDGAIYKAKGIDVKEIPGGCMCCVAGVPLQVAINRLLTETKPDRLFIEPSGLGHPKKVLDTLRSQYFEQVLNINANICLVDPRHLLDRRYTTHENFIDQIALANILVANKSDVCDEKTLNVFDDFCDTLTPPKELIIKTQHGELDLSVIDALSDKNSKTRFNAQFPEHHAHTSHHATHDSQHDGYFTSGLLFNNTEQFVMEKLLPYLCQLDAERVKAVINTNQGWKIINIQNKQASITEIDSASDSRLEIISEEKIDNDRLQQTLTGYLISK